ncbi:MAG TPA: hypothetical protein VJ843_04390 [Candidatus Saccharimonadales bacterium]|nr:hypothetical protein [Candidatus Saccharimonadales bacterium]
MEFYLPHDLPFSAASLQDTLMAIDPVAEGDVSAEFTPRYGMAMSVALVGDDLKENIEKMFTKPVPLKATPTERDEHIDLLHVDGRDLTVMMDPAQVLTAWQLKQFLRNLSSAEDYCELRGAYLTHMWRLTLRESGYFALGTEYNGGHVLSAQALASVLQPKYGVRSVEHVDLVMLDMSADSVGPRYSIMVRIHVKGAAFATDFHDMADRLRDNMPNGFSRLLYHMGPFLQMHYEGSAWHITHPQELGRVMHNLLRPVFGTIRALPADGAAFHIHYPNPEEFRPATVSQTSVTHYLPVVSDR